MYACMSVCMLVSMQVYQSNFTLCCLLTHNCVCLVTRWKCASGDVAPASEGIPSSAQKDQRAHTLPPGRSINSGTSTPCSAAQQKRLSERNPINNPHKYGLKLL